MLPKNTKENVKSFQVSSFMKLVFWVSALIGIATFAYSYFQAPERMWPSFLVNYFFFFCIGVFGVLFAAIQHITNAYWSVTVRRLAEGLISYLPVAIVLAVVLFMGRHHLYEWTHGNIIQNDELVALKTPYLNSKFFAIRLFGFLGIFTFFGFKMRKNSLLQDHTGEHKFTLSNIKLSPPFLMIFGVTFTLMSFDLLMSLEPHWFSTIYGVYCFSDVMCAGLATMVLMVVYGRKKGFFSANMIGENHIHDITKLLFAFIVFWAYIMFSQLMLQWYANLPEEIPYYIRRFNGGWWKFACILFGLHFLLPFLGLASRLAKRNMLWIQVMAVLMLVATWLDIYFLVMPVFHEQGPVCGWIEAGIALGFFGIFGISVSRFLAKVPSVPLRDPRLEECLAHVQ